MTVKTFSIITICYNDLVGLKRTFNSVKKQNFKNFEWVVVDGASTDGTNLFLQEIDMKGLSWTSEPDKGIYNAMNKGISYSTGEYIVFMNAGDVFYDELVLQKVYIETLNNSCDVFYGDAIYKKPGSPGKIKVALSHNRCWYGMFACHQSIYYKNPKKFGINYREDYKVSGDYAFTCDYIKLGLQFKKIKAPLSIFYMDGISSNNEDVGARENKRVQKEILEVNYFVPLVVSFSYKFSYFLRKYLPSFYYLVRRVI